MFALKVTAQHQSRRICLLSFKVEGCSGSPSNGTIHLELLMKRMGQLLWKLLLQFEVFSLLGARRKRLYNTINELGPPMSWDNRFQFGKMFVNLRNIQ
ncbi:hypothetical protein ACTXT7_001798 [Hymenolepis weldensis]